MAFGRKLQWDLNRAMELLAEGRTCREIAELMNLKREQVYDAFRCRGIRIVRDRRGFRPRWDMDQAKILADQGSDFRNSPYHGPSPGPHQVGIQEPRLETSLHQERQTCHLGRRKSQATSTAWLEMDRHR